MTYDIYYICEISDTSLTRYARQPAFNYPEEDVDPADEMRPSEAAE